MKFRKRKNYASADVRGIRAHQKKGPPKRPFVGWGEEETVFCQSVHVTVHIVHIETGYLKHIISGIIVEKGHKLVVAVLN